MTLGTYAFLENSVAWWNIDPHTRAREISIFKICLTRIHDCTIIYMTSKMIHTDGFAIHCLTSRLFSGVTWLSTAIKILQFKEVRQSQLLVKKQHSQIFSAMFIELANIKW